MTSRRPGSSRPFYTRMKLGRCPNCHRKGLGPQKVVGTHTKRLARTCKYCLEEVTRRDEFGIMIARAICPDSWAEYEAGKGTCANMDGWAVVESVHAAGRIMTALEQQGFPVPAKEKAHAPHP